MLTIVTHSIQNAVYHKINSKQMSACTFNYQNILIVSWCTIIVSSIMYTGKFLRHLIFCEFYSVMKLNFMKLLPCHTFYIAHVDHSRKYFSRKLSDAKISRYTVFQCMFYLVAASLPLSIYQYKK